MAPQTERPSEGQVLTDIRIPFWRLVALLVKVAIAAIPAAIILMIIVTIAGAFVAAIFGSFGGHMPFPRGMRL
jgi:hypothetical protein